jgi:hypothetical protein
MRGRDVMGLGQEIFPLEIVRSSRLVYLSIKISFHSVSG